MLRCAHLPDDGAFGPVVLVWGSAEDIRQLGVLFQSLSMSPKGERIGGVPQRVEMRITDGQRGMQAVDGALTWEMAPSDAAHFSELLASLAASPFPAHQYLDCASGRGIIVKVSLDEYPDHFRP